MNKYNVGWEETILAGIVFLLSLRNIERGEL